MEEKIIEILRSSLPDLKAIYLFGSHAHGNARPDSDVDIAIWHGNPHALDDTLRWEITHQLAQQLKQDVDLINLDKASVILRFQIIHNGKRLFCADATACSAFESLVLSMYVRFNEERAPIIAAIKKRGQILL